MKKVSRRALFALALAIVLAAGTLAFCVKYAVNADKWVTFSGSPHVYTGTNLTGGKIYDRTGARILNTTDGRVYSSDVAVRAATVHLLGDRYGYISAPLLGNFAEQMIGYDKITGLSEASKSLDVTVLHTLVLEKLFGIDKENMANQVNLTYTRSFQEAVESVEKGESQCAFILNPTRVAEIRDVAAAGEKMPQKSTYFYPKLITGLVMNPLK